MATEPASPPVVPHELPPDSKSANVDLNNERSNSNFLVSFNSDLVDHWIR
jgi:hypothetical protein